MVDFSFSSSVFFPSSVQKNLFLLRKFREFSALRHCTPNSPTTHQYPSGRGGEKLNSVVITISHPQFSREPSTFPNLHESFFDCRRSSGGPKGILVCTVRGGVLGLPWLSMNFSIDSELISPRWKFDLPFLSIILFQRSILQYFHNKNSILPIPFIPEAHLAETPQIF